MRIDFFFRNGLSVLAMILAALAPTGRAMSGGTACAENAALAESVYVDSKGFFRIRPPSDWRVREYLDDPRGKVDFSSAARPPFAQLKIIAQVNQFADLQALLRDAVGSLERLKSRYRSMGADAGGSAEESTINGIQAVRGVFELSGKFRQISWQFIQGSNYYTVAYGSQPDLFSECHQAAMRSIASFEPLAKHPSAADAAAHIAASKFRVAQMYIQMGRKDWAMEIIEEGLRIAPNNKSLLELKRQLQE